MNLTTKRAAFALLFALLLKAPITFTELALDKSGVDSAFPLGESSLPDSGVASISEHPANKEEPPAPFLVGNNRVTPDLGNSGSALDNSGNGGGSFSPPSHGNGGPPGVRPPALGPIESAYPLPGNTGGGDGSGTPSIGTGGGSSDGPGTSFFPPLPKNGGNPPQPGAPDDHGRNDGNPPPGGDIPAIDTFPPTIPPNSDIPGDNTFPPSNTLLGDAPSDPIPNGPNLDDGNTTGHVPDTASSAALLGLALASLLAFRKKFAA